MVQKYHFRQKNAKFQNFLNFIAWYDSIKQSAVIKLIERQKSYDLWKTATLALPTQENCENCAIVFLQQLVTKI